MDIPRNVCRLCSDSDIASHNHLSLRRGGVSGQPPIVTLDQLLDNYWILESEVGWEPLAEGPVACTAGQEPILIHVLRKLVASGVLLIAKH